LKFQSFKRTKINNLSQLLFLQYDTIITEIFSNNKINTKKLVIFFSFHKNSNLVNLLTSDKFSKEMLNTEELHPEDLSSPIQKFFVTWMNPMIHLAAKRRLEESDVWNCPKDQTVEYYTNLLWKSWLNEIKEASEKHRHPSLPRAIVKTFQNDILFAGVFQVLFLGFQLGQPYLVGELGKRLILSSIYLYIYTYTYIYLYIYIL
jgi:hypothetical protein